MGVDCLNPEILNMIDAFPAGGRREDGGSMYMYMHIYMYMYRYMCIYVYMYMFIYKGISYYVISYYSSLYIYIYIYIYIYVCIYIYIYIHTYFYFDVATGNRESWQRWPRIFCFFWLKQAARRACKDDCGLLLQL